MSKFDPSSMSLRTAISLALVGAGRRCRRNWPSPRTTPRRSTPGARGSRRHRFPRLAERPRSARSAVRPPRSTSSSPKTSANSPTATSPNRCSASRASRCRAATAAKAATSRCAASAPVSRACASTAWKARRRPAPATSTARATTAAASTSTCSRPRSSRSSRCARRPRRTSKKARSAPPSTFGRHVRSTFNDDTVFTITGRGIMQLRSARTSIRAPRLLFSKKFADGTFGILASGAYQKRNIREVGYSAVDILSANTNANNIGTAAAPILLPYCTPIGWTTTAPSPVPGTRGTTAANCSASATYGANPRTSDLAAFQTVYDLRRADLPNTPGSGAFFPRLPRYVNSEQDTERTGGTLSLQWAPSDNTTISLDGLYSRYQVERRDNYILGLSLGRNLTNNGQPMVSITRGLVRRQGLGADRHVRRHGRPLGRPRRSIRRRRSSRRTSSWRIVQRTASRSRPRRARSNSIWDGPVRLQTFIDAIDVDNFTLDFRGRETPLIGFGIDVSDPAQLQLRADAGRQPDRGRRLFVPGQAVAQRDRQHAVRARRRVADERHLRTQDRRCSGARTISRPRSPASCAAQTVTQALPTGTTLADYTQDHRRSRRSVRFRRARELGGDGSEEVG